EVVNPAQEFNSSRKAELGGGLLELFALRSRARDLDANAGKFRLKRRRRTQQILDSLEGNEPPCRTQDYLRICTMRWGWRAGGWSVYPCINHSRAAIHNTTGNRLRDGDHGVRATCRKGRGPRSLRLQNSTVQMHDDLGACRCARQSAHGPSPKMDVHDVDGQATQAAPEFPC